MWTVKKRPYTACSVKVTLLLYEGLRWPSHGSPKLLKTKSNFQDTWAGNFFLENWNISWYQAYLGAFEFLFFFFLGPHIFVPHRPPSLLVSVGDSVSVIPTGRDLVFCFTQGNGFKCKYSFIDTAAFLYFWQEFGVVISIGSWQGCCYSCPRRWNFAVISEGNISSSLCRQ